jgi:hypothetical protein
MAVAKMHGRAITAPAADASTLPDEDAGTKSTQPTVINNKPIIVDPAHPSATCRPLLSAWDPSVMLRRGPVTYSLPP